MYDVFSGIDFYIGLPRSEHYRAVRMMPISVVPNMDIVWILYYIITDTNVQKTVSTWLTELEVRKGRGHPGLGI